jgi:DNA-binding XRE family transcriptional regulator
MESNQKNCSFKVLRILAGYSQAQLAEKIGTYQVRIHRIETGQACPKPNEIEKIKKVLVDNDLRQR